MPYYEALYAIECADVLYYSGTIEITTFCRPFPSKCTSPNLIEEDSELYYLAQIITGILRLASESFTLPPFLRECWSARVAR